MKMTGYENRDRELSKLCKCDTGLSLLRPHYMRYIQGICCCGVKNNFTARRPPSIFTRKLLTSGLARSQVIPILSNPPDIRAILLLLKREMQLIHFSRLTSRDVVAKAFRIPLHDCAISNFRIIGY